MPDITVQNRQFRVELSMSLGLYADVDGVRIEARDEEHLKAAISTQLHRTKQTFQIAVVMLESDGYGGDRVYRRAILRGKNARTSHALMTISGKNVQLERPIIVAHGEQCTDAQIEEMNRLMAAVVAAQREHDKYLALVRGHRASNHSVDSLLRAESEKLAAADTAPAS